ncbi:MAG: Gldg family protein [Proteobacteria bacterium]|nr:Gldg family protein [Pseudomonadota bacterium]MBU1716901.1 Gldg family protein [Pseudomonadota bacterium]
MKQILAITKKELKAYFGSPMAAIFIGAFLLSALFSFFWVETFFARNIADIRPLFRWMPLLMIFLVAALTMRQWSEEQKMGTLEILLTLPVRLSHLVLGKFLAVNILLAISLALTLGLPLTVSFLGDIDWGPVFGGYLGAMLMASAYIAIGLYVSSKTDNQIIALIVTVILCGILYLIGSAGITGLMGNAAGEFFRALGSGSRFASIERGVIDLRDLSYYGSLSLFFIYLNILSLDKQGWSTGANTASHRRNAIIALWLLGANLLAFNIWLNHIHVARIDLTKDQEYSISATSRDLLANLEEPLILRGYFSEKTHPLLAPLVPRIKDLMEEYRIAGNGRIEVSFIDPRFNEEIEMEANQQYGIKPVPFQIAGRYEASVVNSYFNILIKYGDQFVTLGFNDLIEVQPRPGNQLDVGLRNLEYDLTKSIKKVVYGFQSLSGVLANLPQEVKLTAIISATNLPDYLQEMATNLRQAATELSQESNHKIIFEEISPDPGAGLGPQKIKELYDIDPLPVSIFSDQTFYLHLLMTTGEKSEPIYLDGEMGKAEIRREVEAALKRHSSGFMKTVGLWLPKTAGPQMSMYQPQAPQGNSYRIFQQIIRENYNLQEVDLADGRVPGEIDVLLLVAPQDMTALQKLAVDQYLMRGGAVVALAGSYQLDITPESRSLNIKEVKEGLAEILTHYGIKIEKTLVLDQRNEPFPVPVNRNLGGFMVQEIQLLDYPFFVDVRSDGMDRQSPIVAALPAVTMNWVSPMTIDQEKNSSRKLTTLLKSSPDSWLRDSTDIQPNFSLYPKFGFPSSEQMASQILAVSVQGEFSSFFANQPDPRLSENTEIKDAKIEETEVMDEDLSSDLPEEKDDEDHRQMLAATPIIKRSSATSRLTVIGCSEFINDTIISMSQSMGQERFLNGLSFLQNTIDWSVADDDLLMIRSRGTRARLLSPLTRTTQTFWEWLNYGLALLALAGVSIYGALKIRREKPMELADEEHAR